MDISEQYIKMCGEAARYLPKHTFIYGDLWSDDGATVRVVMPSHFPISGCIPVYRQDQLQEMVLSGSKLRASQLLAVFTQASDFYSDMSMEQLWLAFVMKENHNKVWENGEWKIIVSSAH